MSVVNDNNRRHFLNYEGLEDLIAKIKDTFVRKNKYATESELGLIKAWDNNGNISLQSHNPDAKNYPVQITSDGMAFVNVPETEIPEVVIPEIKIIDEDMIKLVWDDVIGIEPAIVGVNYINDSKLT